MRDLHATMLGAVLGGEGLEGVAELAAAETGGPVAIVLVLRLVPPIFAAPVGGVVADRLYRRTIMVT